MNMPRRTKIAFAITASLIAVTAVVLVALLNFDWNRARPWLNARTSEAIGRPFVIVGDLTLSWEKPVTPNTTKLDQGRDQGWRSRIPWPHLVAHDIHIGNPPAMAISEPVGMANIKQFSFSLNPLALLKKNISIPVLSFDSPVINLLRDADGNNNWTFKPDDKPSPWRLELQHVIFTQGSVHLVDAIKHADVTADIETIDSDPVYGVTWQIHGKLDGETVSGNGKSGNALSLQHQTEPYPIMAHLRVGKTVIAIDGTLTKPTDLAALDMRLKLSGISMARLYALSGIVLPETPPYETEGHLVGTMGSQGSHWVYEKFNGKVGSSDIGGSLDYQSRQSRPLLSGAIVSHSLLFSDLAPLIGADSNLNKSHRGAAAVQPENKVLPVESFRTERWTSIDADIKFNAEKIIRNEALPINKLMTNIHLQDGVLSLSPLDFEMADGNLSSNIILDGSGKIIGKPIQATMKTLARHLKLKQLFPTLQLLQGSIGEINGDASLSGVGNSVASLLGASNGEIKILINQGTVSKLLLEEMGLNIGNVILSRLGGDRQIKLNCMASDFEVNHGLMQARSFIIDTDDAIFDVTGNINLAQEQLDLTINTNSKGLRVFSLRAPIYVRGSFKQPLVSVDKKILAMKAGGAIGLAILAPVAALIPLIRPRAE